MTEVHVHKIKISQPNPSRGFYTKYVVNTPQTVLLYGNPPRGNLPVCWGKWKTLHLFSIMKKDVGLFPWKLFGFKLFHVATHLQHFVFCVFVGYTKKFNVTFREITHHLITFCTFLSKQSVAENVVKRSTIVPKVTWIARSPTWLNRSNNTWQK